MTDAVGGAGAGLPDGSNVFGAVGPGATAEEVAAAYGRAGWSVRACGWTEWEVACAFAELVVEPSGDRVLVHGAAADLPAGLARALAPVREAGLPFTAECYGADGGLLAEVRGPPG